MKSESVGSVPCPENIQQTAWHLTPVASELNILFLLAHQVPGDCPVSALFLASLLHPSLDLLYSEIS